MLTSETAHWHEVIINESQTNRPDERPAKKTLKPKGKINSRRKIRSENSSCRVLFIFNLICCLWLQRNPTTRFNDFFSICLHQQSENLCVKAHEPAYNTFRVRAAAAAANSTCDV